MVNWENQEKKKKQQQTNKQTNNNNKMSQNNNNNNNNGKLMPNLDQRSTKILNLTVLQRIDPFVEEILITAAHVTLYEFNIDLSQWSRKDVEGSLFVVKRNTQPRFQFVVMNRRNTDNLVENLLGDFEYELHVPYILYRNAAQEVNGIWFYNARECEEVANLLSRIINAYTKLPPKSKVTPTKSDFEELEAAPSMSVMDGPLEPSSTAAAIVTTGVPDDPSFVNFFSSALTIGNAIVSQSSQQIFCASPPMPILQVPSPSSTHVIPLPDIIPKSNGNNSQTTNLVKPSSFFGPPPFSASMTPPVPSSMPTAPPLHPPVNLQRPYGVPLLQPFPPPTPPPSLTPASVPTPSFASVISRESVQDALLILVQDNQFINMVYQALLNAHHS